MADRDYCTDEAAKVLDGPKGYVRAPDVTMCKNCKAMVQSSHRYCPGCTRENQSFSEVAEAVSKGGRAQGFKRKATPLVNMEEALTLSPGKRETVVRAWGDMVNKTRLIGKTTPKAEAQAPSAAQPSVQTSSSSTSKDIAKETTATNAPELAAEKAAPPSEYDLDDPLSATEYLCLFWPDKSRDEAKVLVEFYIQTTKAKVSKAEPLSALIQKGLLKPGILMKKDGRQKWLEAQRHARAIRFVQKPAFAK